MSLYVILTNNGLNFNSAYDNLEKAKEHARNIAPVAKSISDVVKGYPNIVLYSNTQEDPDPVLYRICDGEIMIDREPVHKSDICKQKTVYVVGGNNGLYAYSLTKNEAIEYARINLSRDDIFKPKWMKVWEYRIEIGSSIFVGIKSLRQYEVWSSHL